MAFGKIRAHRTHDLTVYLEEEEIQEPKEKFVFSLDCVSRDYKIEEQFVLADVGCAAGEFIRYLRQIHPRNDIIGIDFTQELIDKAAERFQDVTFTQGSVLDKGLLAEDSVDVLFMLGVHSIFDDVRDWLDNIVHWTRRGGRICVFGMFNPFPVDVLTRIRRADADEDDSYELGWNYFSKERLGRRLGGMDKVKGYRFEDFTLGIDISPRADDPFRTWTVEFEGRKRVMNGSGILVNQACLIIEV